MADLLTVPFSGKRKKYLQELAGGFEEDQQPGPKKAKLQQPEVQKKEGEQLPASHYLLSPQQLRDREFAPALYTQGLPLGERFAETQPAGVHRS